jgi:hypothetical protein
MLLPSLWTGLLVTDYYHKLLLTGASPIPPPHDYSLFGMFSFTSGSPERIQQIINLHLKKVSPFIAKIAK